MDCGEAQYCAILIGDAEFVWIPTLRALAVKLRTRLIAAASTNERVLPTSLAVLHACACRHAGRHRARRRWFRPAAAGEIPAIASRQRAEKKSFTDSEIIEGFFKTAFGAEYHLAGRVDRIRKYDMPVRVFADGADRPDRKAQLAKVVADIGQRVQHLDIAMAPSSDAANVVVNLVRDRDLSRTIATSTAANGRAKFAPRSIRNACPASARTKNSRSSIPT